jgi:quercetin dioxygenase-like cupin family protein
MTPRAFALEPVRWGIASGRLEDGGDRSMKRLGVFGALLALAVSAGTALATPGVGITSAPILARGTNQTAQLISAAANTDAVTVQLTLAPGATTGWHTHPGQVTVVVTAGTVSLWRTPDCLERTLQAGDSVNLSDAVVAPGGGTGLDLARNQGTVPATVMLTHVNIPVGSTALLQPVSTTPCTTAPQDFTMTGLTATPIARGTFAIPLNFNVATETDIINQTVTIAPGGSTGWHGHPGTTMVVVSAGTGTFVHSDCTTTTQPTGSAFLDTPNTVHNFRNDGTVPLVIHVTYTNVPAAGVFRLDQPAPACAGTAAAAATPAPAALPNTATFGEPAFAALALLMAAILASSGIVVGFGWVERRRGQTR